MLCFIVTFLAPVSDITGTNIPSCGGTVVNPLIRVNQRLLANTAKHEALGYELLVFRRRPLILRNFSPLKFVEVLRILLVAFFTE